MNDISWTSGNIGLLPFEENCEPHETHISLVLLTNDLAYKFKKPVKFSFVDYSTYELRWQAACAEVALNRRLSSGVYLGVRPLRWNGAAFEWAGELMPSPDPRQPPPHEQTDNAAVVMRRLDDKRFMSHLLGDSTFEWAEALRRLGQRLNRFHRDCALSGSTASRAFDLLRANTLDNFRDIHASQILKLPGLAADKQLGCIERYAAGFFENQRDLLMKRAGSGRVVDGHGDLRLEHVCVEDDEIQIYDCVEFSPEIRHGDIASEIGFLSMDLEFNRRDDLAHILELEYVAAASDPDLELLLPFFKQYRAMVRAKVEGLRAAQLGSDPEAVTSEMHIVRRFISLAARYACGVRGPMLLLICGMTGTGKSTLARILAEYIYCDTLNSDEVRKHIYSAAEDVDSRSAPYASGIYSTQANAATYSSLNQLAAEQLKRRRPVIIDASFMRREHRDAAIALARSSGAASAIIECTLAEDENLRRLETRRRQGESISDGRPEILREQMRYWEPIAAEEADSYLELDMAGTPDQALERALAWISGSKTGP